MILQRNKPQSDRTTGILTLPDGQEFDTLELPWLDNKPNISCIYAGFHKFKRDLYGRFKWFKIIDVDGRTNIEFHIGFEPSHSQGCILVSLECLNAMMKFYGDTLKEYVLEIRDYVGNNN